MRSSVFLLLAIAVIGCGGTKARNTHELTQRQQAAVALASLGTEYFKQGNWEEAKEKLERALEQDSRNVAANFTLGVLYDRLGEPKKAEAHLERAVSLEEKNFDARNAYAAVLCRHGKFQAGEKNAVLAAADPLNKLPEQSLLSAGSCALGAGDLARAEKHYRRALEIRPRFAPALFEMVKLEFHVNQFLLARGFLERLIAVERPTAPVLLLGYRIETALNNRSVAADYARKLRADFTTSDETKVLVELERRSK